MRDNNNFIRKTFSFLLITSIMLSIISVSLYIIWQKSIKYNRSLDFQIKDRNELIQSLYNNNLILDHRSVKLLNSLCLNDSIVSASALPKKIADTELRIIHNIMKNYIEIVETHDIDRYASLFTDKVPRFFLRDSLSNKDVYYHMQWYWKTYPNDKTPAYNLNSMSIDKDSNGYIIFLPSIKGETEIITEIRLNKDFKIYYIRDYHAYIDKSKK